MSKYQTPCRYDFVGSFLRPQEVKQAKADYAEGKISEEEKDRIIDEINKMSGFNSENIEEVENNLEDVTKN